MHKVLYIEDEPSLALIVTDTLNDKGYDVHHFDRGNKAIRSYTPGYYDICLIDIMLPDTNGYEVAKYIRSFDNEVPIIFITAKDQSKDVIEGFRVGGNDYIRKPFNISELMVRMNNLLQIMKDTNTQESFQLGNYSFDVKKMTLISEGRVVSLSYKESQILELLLQKKDEVVDRRLIISKVWHDDSETFTSRTLDVYISKLRKILTETPVEIITLKGVGYRLLIEQ